LAVDEEGHVTDAVTEIPSGVPSLDQEALAAARRMVFSPAREGREAVAVYLNLPVRFVEPPPP
jgi:TonB family protein